VADDQLTKSGYKDKDQTAKSIRTAIEALNSSAYPRAFYPPYYEESSDTMYVKALASTSSSIRNYTKGSNIEWTYNILLIVIDVA